MATQVKHPARLFPRLTSRGPIEALRPMPASLMTDTFPRLTSRGPIEALDGVLQHSFTGLFPRLTSRGPIEALIQLV